MGHYSDYYDIDRDEALKREHKQAKEKVEEAFEQEIRVMSTSEMQLLTKIIYNIDKIDHFSYFIKEI